MAKIKKKGAGQARNFITRTQAVRKLQISLPDFRRLCIFKGIYPREPRNKKKASKSSTPSTTFYYSKDIQYLLHEPLLAKFREHKTLAKKISKALGRGENSDAARLERVHKPRLTLDHLIKERYPTFIDALRDLDDALSMLFLFASLPSTSTVPPKTIALCQRLVLEFQNYIIVSHSLRKSFLSIKGIYYQATIQGQDILWLVPYQFVQKVSSDVDFRIMGTFVEFYTTLLGFVNYRLYTSIGLVYPPKFNIDVDNRGGSLQALTLETVGLQDEEPKRLEVEDMNGDSSKQQYSKEDSSMRDGLDTMVQRIAQDEEAQNGEDEGLQAVDDPQETNEEQIDSFDVQVPAEADILAQPAMSTEDAGALFSQLTIFLSRETPRSALEFILRSFGCKRIGWDEILGDGAFTHDEKDTRTTHQIVDRPPLPAEVIMNGDDELDQDGEAAPPKQRGRVPGRTYVQPQWVWDCINAKTLVGSDAYAPGSELPPHLSPFVKPKANEYDPSAPLPEQEEDEVEVDEIEEGAEDEVEGDGEEVEEEEEEDQFASLDEMESDQEDQEAAQHQLEIEAEAAGANPPLSAKAKPGEGAAKRKRRENQQKDEELDRQKMMMSRKKRKMLDKMLYSNKQKEEAADELRQKRRRAEKAQRTKA